MIFPLSDVGVLPLPQEPLGSSSFLLTQTKTLNTFYVVTQMKITESQNNEVARDLEDHRVQPMP